MPMFSANPQRFDPYKKKGFNALTAWGQHSTALQTVTPSSSTDKAR